MELVLLGVAGVALVAASSLAFKLFWPSAPDPSATASTTSLLGGPGHQLTTGQIARGVFWGMWLFWLSQIFVAAIVMFVLFLVGAVAIGSLGQFGG